MNVKSDKRRYAGLSERGATMVFVAVSIIGLLAMTAFSFDFGRVYVERRELQVGAEAAVLAIARDCALGECVTGYDEYAEADSYADANARDGAAWIQSVDLDMDARSVHVITGTEDPGGDHEFDMTFAQVVGVNAFTVGAEARAVWGTPGRLSALPLIFSECEWYSFGGYAGEDPPDDDRDDDGNDSNDYLHRASAVRDGYLPPDPMGPAYGQVARFVTIYFHGSNGDCHHSPSGQDLPGGFGWLDGGSDCEIEVEDELEAPIDPGASPSSGCSQSLFASMVGSVQLLPYFDGYDGTGSTANYTVSGFGAILVTGYNFGGQYKEDSIIDGQPPCTGDDRCIQGYIIGDWVAAGGSDIGGGSDLGVNIIGLSG